MRTTKTRLADRHAIGSNSIKHDGPKHKNDTMSLQLPCLESRSHFIRDQLGTPDKSNPLQTPYLKSRSKPSFTNNAANTNTKLHNDPNLSNTIKANTDTTPRKDLGCPTHENAHAAASLSFTSPSLTQEAKPKNTHFTQLKTYNKQSLIMFTAPFL